METIISVSSDDINEIEQLVYKKDRGLMVDSKRVVELYNKVMYPKTARPTSCSGCLKGYIQSMQSRLSQLKAALALPKEEVSVEQPKAEVKKDTKNKTTRKKTTKK